MTKYLEVWLFVCILDILQQSFLASKNLGTLRYSKSLIRSFAMSSSHGQVTKFNVYLSLVIGDHLINIEDDTKPFKSLHFTGVRLGYMTNALVGVLTI